jgi:hypothetical protein
VLDTEFPEAAIFFMLFSNVGIGQEFDFVF